jgi:small subunit ribosomal protein S17
LKKELKKIHETNEENKMQISTRGKSFVGKVVSAKMHKTVVVEWERRVLVPKYNRYTKRRSKVSSHNPDEINAQEGDFVRIKEVRPLSKTKNFTVTEIVKSLDQE